MAEKTNPTSYAAPALEKGLDILELLVTAEHGLTMAEIASSLGRSMSEIFRMAMTLQRRAWIYEDRGGRYHLTSKMFELAHQHMPVRTLVEVAVPIMQSVVKQAWQSCHLTIVNRGEIIVIAQVESPSSLAFGVRVGTTHDLLNTASGEIHMAFRTPSEQQKLLEERAQYGASDSVPNKAYLKAIQTISKLGYAVSQSQQIRGVTNIGFPVWGRNQNIVAALMIPYMEGLGKLRGPTVEEVKDILEQGATEISRTLGYFES